MLPPIWRKPRWVALIFALCRPITLLYAESTGVYTKLKRRAACDGSIIALEYLIATEFSCGVKIIESNTGDNVFLKQRNEPLIGTHIFTRNSQDRLYLKGKEGYAIDVDYKVNMLETVTPESLLQIHAIVGIYNSAGFTYKVEING